MLLPRQQAYAQSPHSASLRQLPLFSDVTNVSNNKQRKEAKTRLTHEHIVLDQVWSYRLRRRNATTSDKPQILHQKEDHEWTADLKPASVIKSVSVPCCARLLTHFKFCCITHIGRMCPLNLTQGLMIRFKKQRGITYNRIFTIIREQQMHCVT